MEGVPVQVAERYRVAVVEPPPAHVARRLSSAKRLAEDAHYDFSLESTVLRRLDEWRRARSDDRLQREERIRRAEEAKNRAAAAAATLQRLHLAEVTYPSAADINDDHDDHKEPPAPTSDPEPSSPAPAPAEEEPHPELTVPTTSDGILQPTPVNTLPSRINLLDDLDPIAKYHIKSNRFQHLNGIHKNNVDKMTFSDFENDTSSPFDNLELKSINDLELLAQVLNTQQPTNTNAEESQTAYPTVDNTFSPVSTYGYDQTNPYSNLISDNYYNYYASNYAYVPNAVSYQPVQNNYDDDRYKFYNYPTTYAPQYPQVSETSSVPLTSDDDGQTTLLKSRSKSVPDIVKELDEEVAEARLKARERSHNCSPAPSRQVKQEASSSQENTSEKLSDPFDGLAPKLQTMCSSIGGMGFPLDRVARACNVIGDDDKKVCDMFVKLCNCRVTVMKKA